MDHCGHCVYSLSRVLISWRVSTRYQWAHCHDDHMSRNRQEVVVLSTMVFCEGIDEIALSWILERHHLMLSVLAVARSAEVQRTGLWSPEPWFPYLWESAEAFDVPEGHTSISRKLPLAVNVILTSRPLPALADCSVVDWLLLMDEARMNIFDSYDAPALVCGVMVRELSDVELTSSPDDGDGDDLDFVDRPIDSLLDVRTRFRRSFDSIRVLCPLGIVAVPEEAGDDLRLESKRLIDITETNFAKSAWVVVWELMHVSKWTAGASLAGWNLEKTDILGNRSGSVRRNRKYQHWLDRGLKNRFCPVTV